MRLLFQTGINGPQIWLSERAEGDMRVDGNRNRFLGTLHLTAADVALNHQIHSALILDADHITREEHEADGLYSNANVTLGVRIADCLPVFAWSQQSRWRAVVHAGWRGIADGIIENLIAIMPKAADLQVAIGPSIGADCMEVGEEMLSVFLHEKDFFARRQGKWFLDLRGIVHNRLSSNGLKAVAIHNDTTCTHCDPKLWSHRRDQDGRMLAIMMGF